MRKPCGKHVGVSSSVSPSHQLPVTSVAGLWLFLVFAAAADVARRPVLHNRVSVERGFFFFFFNQPVFLYNKHDNKEFGERIRQLKALYSLITENCGMYE